MVIYIGSPIDLHWWYELTESYPVDDWPWDCNECAWLVPGTFEEYC